jgi:hypothetical protein
LCELGVALSLRSVFPVIRANFGTIRFKKDMTADNMVLNSKRRGITKINSSVYRRRSVNTVVIWLGIEHVL